MPFFFSKKDKVFFILFRVIYKNSFSNAIIMYPAMTGTAKLSLTVIFGAILSGISSNKVITKEVINIMIAGNRSICHAFSKPGTNGKTV